MLLSHLQFLSAAATDFPGMKDGIALLKVWLNQRQLSKVRAGLGFAHVANVPLASSPFLGWKGDGLAPLGGLLGF